jgi:hypothetical protein
MGEPSALFRFAPDQMLPSLIGKYNDAEKVGFDTSLPRDPPPPTNSCMNTSTVLIRGNDWISPIRLVVRGQRLFLARKPKRFTKDVDGTEVRGTEFIYTSKDGNVYALLVFRDKCVLVTTDVALKEETDQIDVVKETTD